MRRRPQTKDQTRSRNEPEETKEKLLENKAARPQRLDRRAPPQRARRSHQGAIQFVEGKGVNVYIRWSKSDKGADLEKVDVSNGDLSASCGQLSLRFGSF